MKASRTGISIIILLAVALVLSACGSGGGGGGSTAGEIPPVTYSIMGIVSGAPQGVTVTLSGTANASTTTNAIGYYQFTDLSSSGSYFVSVSLSGYTFSPAIRPITISNASAINQDFMVIHTYGIAGSVKLANGIGLSGATITLVHSSGASTTRVTDASGNYSALELAAGIYTISSSMGGHAMNPINQKATVTCDVRTGIDFTATAGATYSIVGTASPGGVALNLSGSNSGVIYTSLSGTYSFTGLLPGSYTIAPSGGSIITQTCTPPISLVSADLTCNFTFDMLSGIGMPPPLCLSLSGTISGAISSAVTITANAFRNPTPYLRTATTDSSGNYLVSIPSGTYVITPSFTGYTFNPPRICGAVSSCSAGSPTLIPGNNFISQ